MSKESGMNRKLVRWQTSFVKIIDKERYQSNTFFAWQYSFSRTFPKTHGRRVVPVTATKQRNISLNAHRKKQTNRKTHKALNAELQTNPKTLFIPEEMAEVHSYALALILFKVILQHRKGEVCRVC